MKFSDGYWMVRQGFDVQHPAQAHDVTADGRTLSILAPTRVITARGDTLNRPTATITLSTPLDGVIRVRIEHHSGGRDNGPNFALPGADNPTPGIDITGDDATFTSGELTARVFRGQAWRLDFESAGNTLTSSSPKSIGLATGPDGQDYVYQQLSLGVGEQVYGLGERFGPVEKTGQTVDIWNADGGTSSEQAYKNVPFFWTNRGYGIFVNHPEQVSFEIGSEAVSRTQFSVPGQHLEYFVIHGPSPKDILEKYTRTDRPAAPRPGVVVRAVAVHTRSPPITTKRLSAASSTAWPSARSRSASSISTASGCVSSAGATSTGIRSPSLSRRRCSLG